MSPRRRRAGGLRICLIALLHAANQAVDATGTSIDLVTSKVGLASTLLAAVDSQRLSAINLPAASAHLC
jgi:hypothetical protein